MSPERERGHEGRITRRELLAGGVVGLGTLAGCGSLTPGPGGTASGSGSDDGTAGGDGGAATGSAGGSGEDAAGGGTGSLDAVGTELVAAGLTTPLGLEVAPGDREHLFVVDQVGQVRIVGPDGLQAEPFVDVGDRMVRLRGYEERGLLGMAFHPDFERNRRVYLRYSAPPRASTPSGYSHTFVLSEFRARSNGLSIDPGTERSLLSIPQPQSNHNAGSVVFGPDDSLYVGVGDGGAGDDQGRGHVDDWYDAVAGGNGQDLRRNLLGSILRIDVDGREGDRPYAIPDDNPLVGRPGLDEQYAWGFRNPWRMSFSGTDLFVADVGQNRYEEVDLVVRGGNYGWNVREGRHCFQANDCPDETPDGDPLREPIVEYPHARGDGVVGISIIGGYVYEGERIDPLRGTYVFGDWRSNGRLFTATPPATGDGSWPTGVLEMTATGSTGPGSRLLAFGRDHDDELYVLTNGQQLPRGSSGRVHRLVPRT